MRNVGGDVPEPHTDKAAENSKFDSADCSLESICDVVKDVSDNATKSFPVIIVAFLSGETVEIRDLPSGISVGEIRSRVLAERSIPPNHSLQLLCGEHQLQDTEQLTENVELTAISGPEYEYSNEGYYNHDDLGYEEGIS